MLQGFRTFVIAALMAAVPSLTAWLAGVDWVSVLTHFGVPQPAVVPLAGAVAAAMMALMRSVTTTPPGVK